jgi:hypothetical protein
LLISARLGPVAIFTRHSEQTGGAAGGCRRRRRNCLSLEALSIVPDCAGRHGSRKRKWREYGSRLPVREHDELEGCACDAGPGIFGKPMYVRLIRRGRTRCCCSTARARQSRRRRGSEEVVEHVQGLDSRFVSGGIQAGDLLCGESGVPPIGYTKLSAMKNRAPVDRSVDLSANPRAASTGRYVPPEGWC